MHAPKAPPKQQPLACLCAKSDCVGVCDSCKDAITTGWYRPLLFQICVFPNAMRSLPVSIIGVPTHDVQLRSVVAVRINKCRPGNPSGNLSAAKSPTQQQINCVVPEKRTHQMVALLSPPLEEWCGKPLHHPPKCTVKVAR